MTASAARGAAFLDSMRFTHEATISDEDLAPYLEAVNPGKNVVSVAHFAPEVAQLMAATAELGDPLPFPKTQRDFRFRPGETTLWFGINGHGKSALTSQVALYLAIHGRKSCLASFEMPPVRTVQRMVLQAANEPKPSPEFIAKFFTGFAGRMYVYDKTGNINPALMFAAMRYAAQEKQVSHFFVDSLMKCVRGEDDYNGQKDFVNDLMAVTRDLNIHTHLIHHVRKGADEKGIPSKFDAKGSGAVTDQVDNVLCVWRNKAKEQDDEKALEMGAALTAEGPDFLLICDKQRHGNWEGRWALWGNRRTWHFRETKMEGRGYKIPEYQPKLVQAEPGANG